MDEQQAKQEQERAMNTAATYKNYTARTGAVAGRMAAGVADPNETYQDLGDLIGGCPSSDQISAPSSLPSCESTRTLLHRRIAQLRRAGEQERETGRRRLAEADALEALSQSLPLLLSHAADEGLRVLLGFGNR